MWGVIVPPKTIRCSLWVCYIWWKEKVKILRSHGIQDRGKNKVSWYYDIKSIGFNYRINDFQCALGISQLKKLKKFLKKRRNIAKYYFKKLEKIKFLELPQIKYNSNHSYHLFPILINFDKIKIDKKQLFSVFKKNGIILQVHYIPIYRFTYFKNKYNFLRKSYPNSENFYKNSLSLPIFYSIKQTQLNKVVNFIKKIKSK